VVVRSVFKVLEQPPLSPSEGTNCTFAVLDRMGMATDPTASPVVRCELELPSSGGTEEQRALNAKEAICLICGSCPDKGCPDQVGKWYSDSYTTVARGCDISEKDGYTAQRTGIEISPSTKYMLAKFEVCNTAKCFNAEAERAKQMAARACGKGKCA
jgi:hypothetical protein